MWPSALAFVAVKIFPAPHRVLIGLLAAIAVVASACGVTRGAGDPAATVQLSTGDSVEVSSAELDQILVSIESSPRFIESAFSGTMPPGIEAQLLTTLVIEKVIDSLLSEEGATTSDASIETERLSLRGDVGRLFEDEAVTEEVVAELDPYLASLARIRAKQATLGEILFADQPEPEMVTLPCTSHILVATETEADDLIEQLSNGGDFATLATELSLDPGSGAQGGSLGCSDPERFVPEFRDAVLAGAEGELLGPIETQFGFHVIVIDGFETSPASGTDASTLASTRIGETLNALPAVEVNPQIGFWDTTRSVVVPPLDQ